MRTRPGARFCRSVTRGRVRFEGAACERVEVLTGLQAYRNLDAIPPAGSTGSGRNTSRTRDTCRRWPPGEGRRAVQRLSRLARTRATLTASSLTMGTQPHRRPDHGSFVKRGEHEGPTGIRPD